MLFRLSEDLLHAQLQKSSHRNQHLWVSDQIADSQLDAIQPVRAVRSVRSNGGPEVPDVVHGPGLNLLIGPGDEVLVVEEQRNTRRCERELQPSLGMGSCYAAVEER